MLLLGIIRRGKMTKYTNLEGQNGIYLIGYYISYLKWRSMMGGEGERERERGESL